VTTCKIVIKRITNQNGVFSAITRHNILAELRFIISEDTCFSSVTSDKCYDGNPSARKFLSIESI
jgi:hypothetical protein